MKKLMVVLMSLGSLVACSGGGGSGGAAAADTVAPIATPTPTLSLTAQDRTGKEGTPLVVNLVGSDSNSLSLSYKCASGCVAGMTVDSTTGTMSWTPAVGDAGTYNLVFEVSNGFLTSQAKSKVTVAVGNYAPVITPMNSVTINENQTATVTPVVTDPDGDTVTTTMTSAAVSHATFSGGTLTFSPDYTQSGSYTFVFSATDGKLSTSASVTISVSNVNRAPTMTIGAKTIAENSNLSFNSNATDPDGDAITYSITGLPSGASFNTSTGAFSWTPTCYKEGSYSSTITATDGSLSVSQVVPITVTHTNCWAPSLGFVGAPSDFQYVAVTNSQTSMSVPLMRSYDEDTEPPAGITTYNLNITYHYALVEIKCFVAQQNYTFSITGNSASITRASSVGEDTHAYLIYVEDPDGSRTYGWMRMKFTTIVGDQYQTNVTVRKQSSTWSVVGNELFLCPNGSPVVVNH